LKNWIDRDGRKSALARDDVQISVTGHWRSPGGVIYPAGWQLSIPSRQLRAEVRPVLADQELRTQPRYWEGAVDVHARRNATAIEGRGYVELVGYGP